MQSGSLARRYARAVTELGTVHRNLDKIGADLRALAQAMTESPELISALTNPAIRSSERKKVIDALLARIGSQPHTKNLVYLLLDGERLAQLPGISREVDAMIEAKAGKITAEVTSAVDLTPPQIAQITQTLERLSGKKVVLEKKKDPSLLGGVVAKVGDVVYDGSVRTQLRALRDELGK
jgi:F-type H+-transporting ATPase subunit delta